MAGYIRKAMGLEKKMKKKNNILIFYYLVYFFLVHLFLKIPQMVVPYFLKDIFGTNMRKNTEKKWGTPIYLQLAIIKMESDFDWLAKPKKK